MVRRAGGSVKRKINAWDASSFCVNHQCQIQLARFQTIAPRCRSAGLSSDWRSGTPLRDQGLGSPYGKADTYLNPVATASSR